MAVEVRRAQAQALLPTEPPRTEAVRDQLERALHARESRHSPRRLIVDSQLDWYLPAVLWPLIHEYADTDGTGAGGRRSSSTAVFVVQHRVPVHAELLPGRWHPVRLNEQVFTSTDALLRWLAVTLPPVSIFDGAFDQPPANKDEAGERYVGYGNDRALEEDVVDWERPYAAGDSCACFAPVVAHDFLDEGVVNSTPLYEAILATMLNPTEVLLCRCQRVPPPDDDDSYEFGYYFYDCRTRRREEDSSCAESAAEPTKKKQKGVATSATPTMRARQPRAGACSATSWVTSRWRDLGVESSLLLRFAVAQSRKFA